MRNRTCYSPRTGAVPVLLVGITDMMLSDVHRIGRWRGNRPHPLVVDPGRSDTGRSLIDLIPFLIPPVPRRTKLGNHHGITRSERLEIGFIKFLSALACADLKSIELML